MVDEQRVRVVGALGIGRGRRLEVAVIEPDLRPGSGLQVRNADPQERLAQQRIEFLDVEFERGLVVGIDEAQIATVFLGSIEAEVAEMQAHQNRRRTDRLVDAGARGSGVDGDLLAQGPLVVPPRRRGRGPQNDDGGEHEQRAGRKSAPERAQSAPTARSHQNSPQRRKLTRGWLAGVTCWLISGTATKTIPFEYFMILKFVPMPKLARSNTLCCSASGSKICTRPMSAKQNTLQSSTGLNFSGSPLAGSFTVCVKAGPKLGLRSSTVAAPPKSPKVSDSR